jgi:hypothetical protein
VLADGRRTRLLVVARTLRPYYVVRTRHKVLAEAAAAAGGAHNGRGTCRAHPCHASVSTAYACTA